MLVALAVFGGLSEGYIDLTSSSRAYALTLQNEEPRGVQLLRVMDKGILIRENGIFQIYRWEDVKSLARVVQAGETRSFFCKFSSYFCPIPPEP
jgi:hypothetical protein